MQVQESVEEVENSGFLATSSTLDVKLMANNKILQVRVNLPARDLFEKAVNCGAM